MSLVNNTILSIHVSNKKKDNIRKISKEYSLFRSIQKMSVNENKKCVTCTNYCYECYPLFSSRYLPRLSYDIFVYIIGYSFITRLLTLILILETAVLWIGYSLNSVLHLLFIPLVYSNDKSMSNVDLTFALCCFVLPGIISFSSHYFWFVIQFGFHCFANDETEMNNFNEEQCTCCQKIGRQNLSDKNSYVEQIGESLLCNPSNKVLFRCLIFLAMIFYILFLKFYHLQDMFTAIISALGLFPIGLMWFLHIMHLVGIASFIRKSFKNQIEQPQQQTEETKIDYKSVIFVCSSLILMICSLQNVYLFNLPVDILIGVVLISIYLLLYKQTPIKMIHIHGNKLCCCCYYSQNNSYKNPFYRKNVFTEMICKLIEISSTMKEHKIFHLNKLFIMFILGVMLIPLNQILTDHLQKYHLLIISFAKLFLLFLWIPPLFNKITNEWILKKQIYFSELLLMLMCLISSLSLIFSLFIYTFNKNLSFFFVLCLLIYCLLMFYYYFKHDNRIGLIYWLKTHESISIYEQSFSIMYILLSFIGFIGLTFGFSIYNETQQNQNPSTLFDLKAISGNFSQFDKVDYRMQACYWNFDRFTIEDLSLFSALTYLPPENVKSELIHFYPNEKIEFDNQFHNYQHYGFGEITYFTLNTPNAVVVAIRGTTLLYEWFIDFDIWTEASISQMLSVLFPWSRLYPRSVQKILVHQLSLLENLFSENETPIDTNRLLKKSSKRFYVKDMIQTLQKINKKYQNKPLILVGHSLGGGLAKLAGIALNNTHVILSISGPGIVYTRAKYDQTDDIRMETINQRVFNIIHDRDVVPWADKQSGLVQYLTCPRDYNRLQCHSINPIFCKVLSYCGNRKHFKINKDICQP